MPGGGCGRWSDVRPELERRRSDYVTAGLDPADVAADPIEQWWKWYADADAAGLYEPNNMVLATADSDGNPDARVVLLRGADHLGFTFFTNYDSNKGRQIASQPRAALVFSWLELHRQVRVRGVISRVAEWESDEYWKSRPRDSQIASAASPQSRPITREALEARVRDLEASAGEAGVVRPDHWGGYRIVPHRIEFWQGRPARLHDRVVYERIADNWQITRLAP
jgi:pyridoxamine 5'-phosphate oxidase